MALWTVSRVAPSHASACSKLDHQQILLDAEPELAIGTRLFWATLLAITLVFLIPIMAGWLLRSAPESTPTMTTRPAVIVEKEPIVLDPLPASIPSPNLPKAQPPPLELLQNSPGYLASTGEE
jgi:hypothetical protein